jgi:hypothetical protein
MSTKGDPMNSSTQLTEDKPSKPIASRESRPVRVLALLNVVPTLSALVLVAAMAGPKAPPYQGD